MLLTAATVIAHDGLLQPGWIQIDGDRVTAAGAGAPPRPLNPELGDQDLGDRIVVPGFVDMHGHGGGGGAFPTGDADQARAAVDLHRRHGTTTSIASLVTAGPADRLRIVGVMAELTDEGLIAGTHLEDPWLSNERPGAHEQPELRDPGPAELDRVFKRRAGDDPDGHAGAGTHRDSTRCGRWSRPGQWRRGSWITAPVGGAVPVGSTAPHDRH